MWNFLIKLVATLPSHHAQKEWQKQQTMEAKKKSQIANGSLWVAAINVKRIEINDYNVKSSFAVIEPLIQIYSLA